MSILDDDPPSSPGEPPARDLVKAEVLTDPMKVILDIRKDIEKFQNGGPRKELVDALRDQFIATRHQAATKAEAVRILALNMLQTKIPGIQSIPEIVQVISTLSKISENDLAVVLGAIPGKGPLINHRSRALQPDQRRQSGPGGLRASDQIHQSRLSP